MINGVLIHALYIGLQCLPKRNTSALDLFVGIFTRVYLNRRQQALSNLTLSLETPGTHSSLLCPSAHPITLFPSPHTTEMSSGSDEERQHALASFKGKLLESREWEAKLKALRVEIKGLQKDFDHTEDNIKALQSVGQIIGEVLKQLDDERCQ